MTFEDSQTMLAVLLVVGLVVGGGIGYFMAPSSDGSNYDAGYQEGYNDGYDAADSSWGIDPPDDFSEQYATKDDVGGLTTLIYGAIGASLIAALASIVSLMQISRRIGG